MKERWRERDDLLRVWGIPVKGRDTDFGMLERELHEEGLVVGGVERLAPHLRPCYLLTAPAHMYAHSRNHTYIHAHAEPETRATIGIRAPPICPYADMSIRRYVHT